MCMKIVKHWMTTMYSSVLHWAWVGKPSLCRKAVGVYMTQQVTVHLAGGGVMVGHHACGMELTYDHMARRRRSTRKI